MRWRTWHTRSSRSFTAPFKIRATCAAEGHERWRHRDGMGGAPALERYPHLCILPGILCLSWRGVATSSTCKRHDSPSLRPHDLCLRMHFEFLAATQSAAGTAPLALHPARGVGQVLCGRPVARHPPYSPPWLHLSRHQTGKRPPRPQRRAPIPLPSQDIQLSRACLPACSTHV